MRDSDPWSSGAREAIWAIQHPRREGVSGRIGLLHNGNGTCTGGDAAPQARGDGPGAAFRGHWHRLDPEDSVQANGIPAATAKRDGEENLLWFSHGWLETKISTLDHLCMVHIWKKIYEVEYVCVYVHPPGICVYHETVSLCPKPPLFRMVRSIMHMPFCIDDGCTLYEALNVSHNGVIHVWPQCIMGSHMSSYIMLVNW